MHASLASGVRSHNCCWQILLIILRILRILSVFLYNNENIMLLVLKKLTCEPLSPSSHLTVVCPVKLHLVDIDVVVEMQYTSVEPG